MNKSRNKRSKNKCNKNKRIKSKSKTSFNTNRKSIIRQRNKYCRKNNFGQYKFGNDNYLLEVIPDIEGSWKKLSSFLKKSQLIKLKKSELNKTFITANYDDFEFTSRLGTVVFLGDAVDNGPDNLKILQFFLHLKIPNKNKIILIAGNRDINKLRLLYELDSTYTKDHSRFETFKDYYKEDYNLFDRIQLLFKNTMGIGISPIQDLNKDDDVFNSGLYLYCKEGCKNSNDECAQYIKDFMSFPNSFEITNESIKEYKGIMFKYLLQTDLIYYDQLTHTLCTHGYINDTNFLYMPKYNDTDKLIHLDKKISTVQYWCFQLNKWYIDILNAVKNSSSNLLALQDIVKPILAYAEGMYDKKPTGLTNNNSITVARPYRIIDKNIKLFEQNELNSIKTVLENDQVTNIVVGHSPVQHLPIMYYQPSKTNNVLKTIILCDITRSVPFRVPYIQISLDDIIIDTFYTNQGSEKNFKISLKEQEYNKVKSSIEQNKFCYKQSGNTNYICNQVTYNNFPVSNITEMDSIP